jgi:hypothetical protein
MSIADQLNSLYTIKNDIKNALKEKGLVTDSTPFSQYPTAMNNLTVEEPTIRLRIEFDNQYYIHPTIGNRVYYASSGTGTKQGILKVNGVDYYSEILGDKVIIDNTQYDQYVDVQVPMNSKVKIEARLLTGNSKTNPTARRHLTQDTMYKTDPDVFEFKVYEYNKTVTYSTYAVDSI